MTDFAIAVQGERIVGVRLPPAQLEADEYIVSLTTTLADPNEMTLAEFTAVLTELDGQKYDGTNLVPQTATDVVVYANQGAIDLGAALDDVKHDLKQKATQIFTDMFAIVTKPKAYEADEKDTWGKQERVALAWQDNWNGGTPTVTITADQALPKKDRQFTVLLNLVAGELKIAKTAVTDTQINDKAESILTNSVDISDYVAAVLGTLHSVINDIDAATTEAEALAVDMSVIEATAAAELGL